MYQEMRGNKLKTQNILYAQISDTDYQVKFESRFSEEFSLVVSTETGK
jgi:hypothetical protein